MKLNLSRAFMEAAARIPERTEPMETCNNGDAEALANCDPFNMAIGMPLSPEDSQRFLDTLRNPPSPSVSAIAFARQCEEESIIDENGVFWIQ